MKTIEVTLYEYEELSDSAKEYARLKFNEEENYDADEERDSLKAFEKTFPIKVSRWNIGYGGSWINSSFLANDEIANLTGWRLATYIWNNYKDDIYTLKSYWKGRFINGKYVSKHRRSKIIMCSQCCPLTGVCFDEDLLDPMWSFLKAPTDQITFEELLDACLHSWLDMMSKDYEYRQSEEHFKEACEANEWTFLESGKMRN